MCMNSFVFIRNIFNQLPIQNITQCDFEKTGSVLKPYIRLTTIQFKLVRFPDVDQKKITRRTTTSERKQVFASYSKFQIENIRNQVTYSIPN